MKFLKVFFWEADVLAMSGTAYTITLTDVDTIIKLILTIVTIVYMLYKIRLSIQEGLKNDLDIKDLIGKKKKKDEDK